MKTVLLVAILMIGLFLAVVPASATVPDVYYYTGDTCKVPSDEHFLSYQPGGGSGLGLMDYRLYVEKYTWERGDVNPNGNHYTNLSDRTSTYKLGMSKALQEKLALTRILYCYTIPDPVDEIKFGM